MNQNTGPGTGADTWRKLNTRPLSRHKKTTNLFSVWKFLQFSDLWRNRTYFLFQKLKITKNLTSWAFLAVGSPGMWPTRLTSRLPLVYNHREGRTVWESAALEVMEQCLAQRPGQCKLQWLGLAAQESSAHQTGSTAWFWEPFLVT